MTATKDSWRIQELPAKTLTLEHNKALSREELSEIEIGLTSYPLFLRPLPV